MADTLRDLVVSLSLDSNNFSANLRSINAQLKQADSEFKAAGAGVKDFENTTGGAEAKLSSLQQKLQLQQQAVAQYERALEQARGKLENSVEAHDKLAAKLDTAREKHQSLGEQVKQLEQKLKEMKSAGQENSEEYASMEQELQQLKEEYKASGEEVGRLEQQLGRSESAMQRNADAVTRANTNLNNARGAVSQTESQIQALNERLERMRNSWLQAADGLAAFGTKATEAGRKIEGVGRDMSKVSAGVVALGTASVMTFSSYDDAIRQVYATMGLSAQSGADEMEALSAAAQEMGASTRYSASEAASALNYLALAGYDSEQAIAALPTVLGLAQAGNIDLASASDMVTDSMSALGLEMIDMPIFADQMAKTSQKSNTSVAQLGEGILKVSATAKNLKGGTVELNTALGILADNGIKGAEGGTHLRNVILSLQSPTDAAAAQLKALGISVYDSEGKMRGLDEIFGDLEKAMSGMSQEAKDATLSTIFNKTDLTAVNALLSNCGDRWDKLSGEIANCKGTADEMADTMEGGIGGAFRSLKSAIEGLAIAFGDTLAPTVKDIAERITEAVRDFSKLDEEVKLNIIKVGALVAVAGPLVLVIGKLTTAIGKTATAISAVMKVMSGLTSGAGLLAVGYAALAIAVIAGTVALADYVSGAGEAKKATKDLKDAVAEMKAEGFKGIYEGASNNALSAFGMSPDSFATAERESKAWFDRVMEAWSDGKKETNEIIASFTDEFTQGSDKAREQIANQKSLLEGYGVLDEETLAQMEADIKTLDSIDDEVTKLLKKRKNGYISEDEQARLQELLELRRQITERWGGDSGATGYDAIQQQLAADIEMANSLGEALDPAKYGQALVAIGQGYQAVCASIESNYQAQYAEIMKISDEETRNAALAALNAQYTQDMADAAAEYKKNLSETAALTVENNGITESIDGLNTLSETLETIRGTAGDQTAESISAVTDWVNGMGAKGMEQLQSLYSLIIQMQGAGMENAEIADALGLSKEELTGVLTTLQSIKEIANGTDSLAGLSDLFSTMDENAGEVLTLTLDINSEEAASQIETFIEGYADRSVNVEVVLDSLTSEAVTAWETANSTFSLTGPMASVGLTLGDTAASDIKTAWEADKLAVYGADGLPLEITPEVLAQITANDVCAYDADGTLHIIITPEVGTKEYVDFANNTAGQEQTGLFGVDIGSTTDQVNKLLGLVDEYNNAMDESSAARERSANTDDFMTKDIENQNANAWLESAGNYADQIDTVVNSLTDADIDNISQQIMALYAALSSGDLDANTAAEYQAQLESLLSVVDLIDSNSSGSAISEGIAEGMVKYGWAGDATTLATGIHTAVDSALQINSPSRLMKPSGTYVAQGIGEGMKSYSFAGDVSNMAASLQSTVSASLNAGTLQSVGTNAMRGLVNGINAGRASVISAMRNAAKAALQAAKNELGIHSPSRVFRDEVGTMIMRGLGEGVSTEARAQAKLIQNASRYLTDEAVSGVSGYTADNRRTYNQQSSVTLNIDGLSVRSDSDVRSLAIEIAALTKRGQQLKGV